MTALLQLSHEVPISYGFESLSQESRLFLTISAPIANQRPRLGRLYKSRDFWCRCAGACLDRHGVRETSGGSPEHMSGDLYVVLVREREVLKMLELEKWLSKIPKTNRNRVKKN